MNPANKKIRASDDVFNHPFQIPKDSAGFSRFSQRCGRVFSVLEMRISDTLSALFRPWSGTFPAMKAALLRAVVHGRAPAPGTAARSGSASRGSEEGKFWLH